MRRRFIFFFSVSTQVREMMHATFFDSSLYHSAHSEVIFVAAFLFLFSFFAFSMMLCHHNLHAGEDIVAAIRYMPDSPAGFVPLPFLVPAACCFVYTCYAGYTLRRGGAFAAELCFTICLSAFLHISALHATPPFLSPSLSFLPILLPPFFSFFSLRLIRHER